MDMMKGAVTLSRLAAIAWLFCDVNAVALTARQSTISTCPGYKASNVQEQNGDIFGADLRLAGNACNVYGTDLDNLRLQVEYQTGAYYVVVKTNTDGC